MNITVLTIARVKYFWRAFSMFNCGEFRQDRKLTPFPMNPDKYFEKINNNVLLIFLQKSNGRKTL